MAKKKKKAGNARGFATTSQAKAPVPVTAAPAPTAAEATPPTPVVSNKQAKSGNKSKSGRRQQNGADNDGTSDTDEEHAEEDRTLEAAARALSRRQAKLRARGANAGTQKVGASSMAASAAVDPRAAILSVSAELVHSAEGALLKAAEAHGHDVASSVSANPGWFRSLDLDRAYGCLVDAYVDLSEMGFKDEDLSAALHCCGPNVENVLDWLCLHVPEEGLPEGWYRENKVSRAAVAAAALAERKAAEEARAVEQAKADEEARAIEEARAAEQAKEVEQAKVEEQARAADQISAEIDSPVEPVILADDIVDDGVSAEAAPEVSGKDWILAYHAAAEEREAEEQRREEIARAKARVTDPDALRQAISEYQRAPDAQASIDALARELCVNFQALRVEAKQAKVAAKAKGKKAGKDPAAIASAKDLGIRMKQVNACLDVVRAHTSVDLEDGMDVRKHEPAQKPGVGNVVATASGASDKKRNNEADTVASGATATATATATAATTDTQGNDDDCEAGGFASMFDEEEASATTTTAVKADEDADGAANNTDATAGTLLFASLN
jgi:hypothetical protein